jgi:N-acetylmuramoyl-L-alanine amidase
MKNKLKFRRLTAAFLILSIFFTTALAVSSLNRELGEATDALSKYGSRGEEVRAIQQKLKNWGYYDGEVDGVFGSKTQAAVKSFQKKNGLTVDGIAGPNTLRAMGISSSSSSSSSSVSQSDLNLLARMISAEARGEPYVGQVAVGAVILNRVRHPSFPNTISGVIYQSGAFSALYDGQFNQPVADSAYKAARDALNGWDPTGGCIYYYNPKTATNQWIRTLPIVTTIGRHVFSRGK